MPDIQLPHDDALTLEQWRRLNLTRPYTDDPIGGNAGSIIRRQRNATASRIVEQIHDPLPDANEAINERERNRRIRRKAAKAASKAPTHPQAPQDAA